MSRIDGTIIGMATRKVTLTMDEWTFEMAEKVAAKGGMSTSAWISAAVRQEVVLEGAGTNWGTPEELEAEALAYDADLAAAEEHLRAQG